MKKFRYINILLKIMLIAFLFSGLSYAQAQELEHLAQKFISQGRTFSVDSWLNKDKEIILVNPQDEQLTELVKLLGGSISFNPKNQTAVITKDLNEVKIFFDRPQYERKDRIEDLPYPAKIIDNKPYIPIPILIKALETKLMYEEENDAYYIDPLIKKIELTEKEGKFYLDIASTGPVSVKTMLVREPERYVIDIENSILDVQEKEIINEKIGKIYFSQNSIFPNLVRIVIPQDKGVEINPLAKKPLNHYIYEIKPSESSSVVQNFNVQEINELSLTPDKDDILINLNSTGPIQFKWHRLKPPDNRFIIDIPLSILKIEKNEMPVDSKLIEKIKIAQFQKDPEPIVRLVIYLKDSFKTTISNSKETPSKLAIKITPEKIDPEKQDDEGSGVSSFSANGKVICIDPGHGGSDPGAVSRQHGTQEKDLTFDISLRLSKILVEQGWNVIMTRKTDVDVAYENASAKAELGARTNISNQMKADIFISIHINAMWQPIYNGISTYWYKKKDYDLAKDIQKALIKNLGRKNKGIIRERFYVLRTANAPSALLELMFISNPEECKLLQDEKYRQKVAEAIAEGLSDYAKNNE